MHTLAQRVVPNLTSLNPKTRVVAFYTDKATISLFRLNGELVWSVPARKQTSASALAWSPDGANLAVVYADGLYQILQECDGKVAQIVANQNAAVLAWQGPRGGSKGPKGDPKGDPRGPRTRFQVPDTLKWNENLVLAVGSRRGELKINLDGVLPLGALPLDSAPVVDIWSDGGNFLVLTRTKLHRVEASYLKTYDSAQINDLVVKPTQVQKTLEQMVTYASKLEQEQRAFETALEQFFNLANPVESIYNALLTGVPDATTAAWLEEMHEAGFRKWHKACNHYYAQFEALLLVLVGLAERLIIYLGELPGVPATATPGEILRGLFAALGQLKRQRKLYLSFAAGVQSIYSSHLDRALKVVDDTHGDLDWIEASEYASQTLADPRMLSGPPEVRKLKAELDEFMAQIKANLTAQFQWESEDVDGDARAMVVVGGQAHVLLKRDGLWVLDGPQGRHQLDCLDAFFYRDKVVLLQQTSVRIATLELAELARCEFGFDAAACTLADGELVVVSSDGLHFGVFEVAI